MIQANTINPDQTAPKDQTWAYIICNIGYWSLLSDEQVDENCHEWQEKG